MINQANWQPSKTWTEQIPIADVDGLIAAMRAFGLPLGGESSSGDDTDNVENEGSGNTEIVCLASVVGETIKAIVALPSGLAYRFEPESHDDFFWSFAARNYYWVTGNMDDRKWVAEKTAVDAKEIKGRALLRKKQAGLSGLALEKLLEMVGVEPYGGALQS